MEDMSNNEKAHDDEKIHFKEGEALLIEALQDLKHS